MANKVGQLQCADSTKNVGFGGCVLNWKQIGGALLYDNPRTFTDQEIAALQATLSADASKDVKASRMFPIHDFRTPTDNTEDVIIETFDNGSKAIVRDGDNDWTFRFVNGGNCLQNSLRTHNGRRWVLFYDTDNKILGYDKGGKLSAIPLQFFYAAPWKVATGSATETLAVRFVFSSKYANEDSQFVKANFDLTEIEGLQDIDIVVNSFNQNTGVVNATLQLNCGSENMYDQYNNQFVAGLFKAYDEDGNTVTVTTLAKVAGNKTFNITLNPAQLPDNGIVTLGGTTVSALVTAGIIGYEIGKVELTVVGS